MEAEKIGGAGEGGGRYKRKRPVGIKHAYRQASAESRRQRQRIMKGSGGGE